MNLAHSLLNRRILIVAGNLCHLRRFRRIQAILDRISRLLGEFGLRDNLKTDDSLYRDKSLPVAILRFEVFNPNPMFYCYC